jgi:hypothetical protein
MNFDELRLELHRKHSPEGARENASLAESMITDTDLMSSAMYPKVG